MGGGFVIDADIRGYFDTLDHRHLREILDRRVRDGVIVRAMEKWLNAGVMEGGVVRSSDTGTPQGGVISPILANRDRKHQASVGAIPGRVGPSPAPWTRQPQRSSGDVAACERHPDPAHHR